VSFGATKNRLTNGTRNVAHLGIKLLGSYPQAKIVFGEFTENPIAGLESKLKFIFFGDAIFSGSVISTIEEAEKWRSSLPAGFVPQRGVIIVTDEMHSRSARRVSNRVWNGWWLVRLWKRITRQSMISICMATFPTLDGIDVADPMVALRSQKLWVLNNVLREFFLMFVPFGYSTMKRLNIHQPVSRFQS
jgi:hypothetical protein